MATVNTKVSAAGREREVALQAPGTVVNTTTTNQWDIEDIPEDVAGLAVSINVTAASTASVTFNIYGRDAYNLPWLILASSAITATGQTILRVHPNLPASANHTAQDFIGKRIRVEAVNTTGSSTYSLTAELIYS